MMTILLEGQNLSVSTPHIVAGTKDYLSVEIVRGVDWKGLSLHVFFQLGNKTYELITDGDYIGPSAHINLSAGMWQVSATGYEYVNGQLVMKITTNKIGLSVAPAPPESGDDLPYIPPTSIEQIEAIAQSVRDDADAGLFKGDKGDPGDPGQPGTTDYEQLVNKPTKVSQFENDSGYMQGVTMLSYETLFGGEFTVTTATDAEHEHPWVRTNITSGSIRDDTRYRITFDGESYVLPGFGLCTKYNDEAAGRAGYDSFTAVGAATLFRISYSGLFVKPQNVPFLLVYGDGTGTSYLDVYTEAAGEHTVLVESESAEYSQIDPYLVYGMGTTPFGFRYAQMSLGANEIIGNLSGFAVGTGNVVSGSHSFAAGVGGEASGLYSCTIGFQGKASGQYSFAGGNSCHSEANGAFTHGVRNVAKAAGSHAEGYYTRAESTASRAHVEGYGCRTYAEASHVEGGGTWADASQTLTHIGGVNNAKSTETGKTVQIIRYLFDGTTVRDVVTMTLGKYAEVIGNGDSDQARSNARTLDWDGNESLAGDLTLEEGGADEVTITAAEYKALKKRAGAVYFGTVDDTSTATVFTASIPGITEYYDGLAVMLQNSVVTSAANFTIDINGIGDKAAYSNMATGNPITPTAPSRETTIFNINYTMLFVYSSTIVEGGAWICYRGYDTNQNTIGYQLRTNSYSLPASDKFYRYRLLFTSADNTKFVPANTSTSTNATSSRTANTRPINPFGPIMYYASTTAIEANAKPGATVLWQQYTLSLGYSFNNTGAALVMTTSKPVYLKCTPQADGSAVMDYFTQALPSTEDGKIYILLGYAYSATNIELIANHPVYYYKNSGVRLWTGA